MKNSNAKIIAAVTLVVLATAVVIVALQHITSPAPEPFNPSLLGNQNPNADYLPAPGPVVTGIDESFINQGVTIGQVNSIKLALQHYKPFSTNKTTIIVSPNFRLNPPEATDPLYRPSISTTALVDQKNTYQIKFYYWGVSNIQLLLFDSTGTTKLFNSGVVTGSS